jgi:hypothetical protein
MFGRKRTAGETPTVEVLRPVSPLRRLKNLEHARERVVLRLANPRLATQHRPELERKLASIGEEIEQLREEAASWR